MEFEYDPGKSLTNKVKHGIDFEEAQALWKDGKLLVSPTTSESEPRFIAIGTLAHKVWSAIYTLRGNAVRLISVRRARPEEIERYESNRQDH